MLSKTMRRFISYLTVLMFAGCQSAHKPVFERVVVHPAPGKLKPKAKVIADVNGDDQPDLLFNTESGFNGYLYPDWDSFRIGIMGSGEDACAADVDGDGDMDVIVSPVFSEGLVWWQNPRPGDSVDAGPWKQRIIHQTIRAHDVLSADINLDGLPDVICEGGILVQEKKGTWLEIPASRFSGMTEREGSAVYDMDRDGDPDYLRYSAAEPFTVIWYENPLPGQDVLNASWRAHPVGPGFEVASVQAGDINGDGEPDVAVAPMYDQGAGLRWYENPGEEDGSWSAHVIDDSMTFVSQNSILIHDFNGDGFSDVLAVEMEQSPSRRLVLFYNQQGGGLEWEVEVIAATGSHNPKYGDIDGDGDIDILNANHGWTGIDNPVELWRNR